jgi:predicted methyltransferase
MKNPLASFFAAFALSALIAAPAAAQTVDSHPHWFSGAERWAQVFDDPERDAWQKPHEVLQALKLAPDASVADIGSGTGYFAVRFAHRVPKGCVYGVDAERDFLPNQYFLVFKPAAR